MVLDFVEENALFFLFSPDTFSKGLDEKDHPTQLSSLYDCGHVLFFKLFMDGFEQGVCSTLVGTLLGTSTFPSPKRHFSKKQDFRNCFALVGDVSLVFAFDCKPSIL